jgi:8-oxo-dGTP diphosphatase
MFNLILVFNKDKSKVLMCEHKKQGALNFIGGKVEQNETILNSAYRELLEETGIHSNDIYLMAFRHDDVTFYNFNGWNMYIFLGVLHKDVKLVEEKNPLLWVDVNDTEKLLNAYGDGNCYTYTKEALRIISEIEEVGGKL